MWQTITDFVINNHELSLVIGIYVVLTIVGLVEMIVQIYKNELHIKFADEYIRHIQIISQKAHDRIIVSKDSLYPLNFDDINEISDSLYYVEVNSEYAQECIEEGLHSWISPISDLSSLLYNSKWNDRDVSNYCHQIIIDYNKAKYNLAKNSANTFRLILIPFTKMYRGYCVLFRLITFPVKQIWENFDFSRKIEKAISFIAELLTLVTACIELIKIFA